MGSGYSLSTLKTSGLLNRIDPINPPAQKTAENLCIFLQLCMLRVYFKSITSTKSAASEQKSKTTADNIHCKQSHSVQQPLAASVLGPETASPPNTMAMVDR